MGRRSQPRPTPRRRSQPHPTPPRSGQPHPTAAGHDRAERLSTRIFAALQWPRPAGVAASLLGAGLLLGGAVGMNGGWAPAADPASVTAESVAAESLAATLATGGGLSAGDASSIPEPAPLSVAPPSELPPTETVPAAPAVTVPPEAAPTGPVLGAAASSTLQPLVAAGGVEPTAWDIGDPASTLVLVNKHHPLAPIDYVPPTLVQPAVPTVGSDPVLLRPEAATAYETMVAAAAAEGVRLTLLSAYRSYPAQDALYQGYLAQKGQAASDITSARPGYSEHQSGLSLDIGDPSVARTCEFTECFASSPAAVWVAAHGAEYGFIVRYPEGQEAVTGYAGEPWHLRYLGVAVARDLAASGAASYEQYLGLPGAPGYL